MDLPFSNFVSAKNQKSESQTVPTKAAVALGPTFLLYFLLFLVGSVAHEIFFYEFLFLLNVLILHHCCAYMVTTNECI